MDVFGLKREGKSLVYWLWVL